jgi:hypothetical protein
VSFFQSCHSEASKDGLAHGAVLGVPKTGVIGYNCNYSKIVEDGAAYDHLNYIKDARGRLLYSGDKWQCVEYARRWYEYSDSTFSPIRHSRSFSLKFLLSFG